jgi:hypothetical protein
VYVVADYSMNRANESQTRKEKGRKKKEKKLKARGSMASINRL